MWFYKRREFGDLERWTFKTRKTKIPTFPQFFWVGTKDTFDTKNNITTWAKQDKGNTTDTQFNINQEWSLQNCILKGPSELDWTWSIVITRHASPKKSLYEEMEPLSDAGNSKPLSSRKPRSLKSPVLLAAVPAVPLCVCVSCCTKQVTHF